MTYATESVLITGNTYHVRAELKALGGRWDAKRKGWLVPADKAERAQLFVDGKVTYSDDKWGQIDQMFDRMTEYQKLKYLSCI